MVVRFDVIVRGIEYSESIKAVSKLEEDGIIEIDEDLRDRDDNDIGSLSGGKKPNGEMVSGYYGIRADHFVESRRTGGDSEGLLVGYYVELSAMTKARSSPNFEQSGTNQLILSSIADELEKEYGDKVTRLIRND
jgi:hypothetical protein